MSEAAVKRTEYWNVSTDTVRGGATGHGESLIDMESYVLPMDRLRGASLYSWGVADGLAARATTGQPGVTVSPGTALDAAGQLIVVSPGGTVIVDPAADPAAQQDVATVIVGDDGITLATAGAGADCLLTLTWREVVGDSTLANAPALLHAPWLRLLPVAGFQDTGAQVVLAGVMLDGNGNVTGLSSGTRRLVGVPTGRLELRALRAPGGAGALSVDQHAAAELTADETGNVILSMLLGAAPRTALTIDAGTAEMSLPAPLSVSGALRLQSGGAQTFEMSAGTDGKWHFTDATANADRLVVDTAGNVSVGIGSAQARRTVHVEGSEVHSGGTGGGFSFADRNVGSMVDAPASGERWVWYSAAGAARLWSGFDRLTVSAEGEGGGLDVARRMRVRQGGDSSAGIWFLQTGTGADQAFAGMADDTHVGFWGNTGAGWGLRMDTSTGEVLFSGNYGRPDGPSTLSLFGSRIGDVGGGVLFIRSGGGVVQISGQLHVDGPIFKSGGGFRIDHPLDPANKYLSHSFVESPEMLNVYAGTVVTDDRGEATVALPDYFAALNRGHCFQVTPVGQLAMAAVDGGVRENAFTIRTDKPGVAVSWQVTGVRQDAWAVAHRIQADEVKPEGMRGLNVNPELHGQPEAQGLMARNLEDPGPERVIP